MKKTLVIVLLFMVTVLYAETSRQEFLEEVAQVQERLFTLIGQFGNGDRDAETEMNRAMSDYSHLLARGVEDGHITQVMMDYQMSIMTAMRTYAYAHYDRVYGE